MRGSQQLDFGGLESIYRERSVGYEEPTLARLADAEVSLVFALGNAVQEGSYL